MSGLDIFFILKLVLAVADLTMLALYMTAVWQNADNFPGRKMRYVALMWFTVIASAASARQITDPYSKVFLEHWLVFAGLIFLFVTMLVSLYEIRFPRKRV